MPWILLIELKKNNSYFYFLNRRKNLRWPHITLVQCIYLAIVTTLASLFTNNKLFIILM